MRSITQTFQLIEEFDKLAQKKDCSVQAHVSGSDAETNTSLPTDRPKRSIPIQLDVSDIRDDEVLECLTGENNLARNPLPQFDELDQETKQVSSVVFSELKSILHKEVY